eukprot:scaffold876_cov243-Pinguiococcus_pyrenoidosus.AAC.13
MKNKKEKKAWSRSPSFGDGHRPGCQGPWMPRARHSEHTSASLGHGTETRAHAHTHHRGWGLLRLMGSDVEATGSLRVKVGKLHLTLECDLHRSSVHIHVGRVLHTQVVVAHIHAVVGVLDSAPLRMRQLN